MRKFWMCLGLMLFSQVAFSQAAFSQAAPSQVARADDLVGATRNGTMSVAQVNRLLKSVFGASLPAARQALDLYKIRYRSRDEKGRDVVLSGLVVLPRGGAAKGLVIFNHGTIADRKMAPSRFNGANTIPETREAVLVFASGGYAVALPDYLGLGDDLSAHPFPLGEVNAQSAVDIVAPARSLARRKNVAIGSRHFVSGYSEGGAVAMWTIRVLETANAPFKVFAGAPLSGPYDLSGATRQSLLAPTKSVVNFGARLYLMAYAVHSFHKNNDVKLTDYFKPSMAFAVSRDFKAGLSDEKLIRRLLITATLMRAKNQLPNVLTPRFLRALQTVDTRDPFVRALKNNDVFDWSPRTKMLLVALQNDQVVVSANTQNTIRAMRRNGIGADVVRTSILQDDKLNHISAVVPALLRARRFFDSGFGAVPTAP